MADSVKGLTNWQAAIREQICRLNIGEGSDYGWAFVERLGEDNPDNDHLYQVLDQTREGSRALTMTQDDAIARVFRIAAEFAETRECSGSMEYQASLEDKVGELFAEGASGYGKPFLDDDWLRIYPSGRITVHELCIGDCPFHKSERTATHAVGQE